MNYLPLILFCLIPFGLWGENIFFGHANTFLLCSLALIIFHREWNVYPVSRPLRFFGGYLCLWVAASYAMAFLDLTRLAPLFYAVNDSLILYIAGVIFFMAVYQGGIDFKTWANAICIVATIQAVLGILQWAGFDPVLLILSRFVDLISQMGANIPTGTMGNQNFLAAFLALSIPFFVRGIHFDRRFFRSWGVALPVILFALAITKTTAAIGAALIGMAYLCGGWRLSVIAVIPAAALYAVKYGGSVLSNARIEYWKNAWESTSSTIQTLVFGWGPGVTWQPGNMLHSEWVNMFFNFGLIGLSMMATYFAYSFFKAENRYLRAAVIIMAVNILGNHAFHIIPTGVLAIVVFALIERDRYEMT